MRVWVAILIIIAILQCTFASPSKNAGPAGANRGNSNNRGSGGNNGGNRGGQGGNHGGGSSGGGGNYGGGRLA